LSRWWSRRPDGRLLIRLSYAWMIGDNRGYSGIVDLGPWMPAPAAADASYRATQTSQRLAMQAACACKRAQQKPNRKAGPLPRLGVLRGGARSGGSGSVLEWNGSVCLGQMFSANVHFCFDNQPSGCTLYIGNDKTLRTKAITISSCQHCFFAGRHGGVVVSYYPIRVPILEYAYGLSNFLFLTLFYMLWPTRTLLRENGRPPKKYASLFL